MRRLTRKIMGGLVTAVALALGLFVIGDRSASGQATSADIYGVGAGSINLGGAVKLIKFAFSAHTGPQGDFGSFRFTVEDLSLDVHVEIDCVNVLPFFPGAAGSVGGAVTKVTPQPNALFIEPGDQMVFEIADFGEPSDPLKDKLAALEGFEQACKLLFPGGEAAAPIDQGNIVIKID